MAEPILPNNMCIDTYINKQPKSTLLDSIVNFINKYDRTATGNYTLISPNIIDRMYQSKTFCCILRDITSMNEIYGVVFSLIHRCEIEGKITNSSYTTYLCIHPDHRSRGCALALINTMKQSGYPLNIKHGYYTSAVSRSEVSLPIKSWYRPINVFTAKYAGFNIKTDAKSQTRSKLLYRIPKLELSVEKADTSHYFLAKDILKRTPAVIKYQPTKKGWKSFTRTFDVYIVGDSSIFALFPLEIMISKTHRTVKIAQLSLSVGNIEEILTAALYISKESDYDLLHGNIMSNITAEALDKINASISTAENYLEFYNSESGITIDKFSMPLH